MSINARNASIDWERQRAFMAVMREGSLSAAARVLNVAQPTVRRRIEDLESEHGIVLFTRSPTGLLPTAIAHELTAHVEAMSSAARSFARAASAEAGSPAGAVRITASEVVGVEVLPPMLAALRARHPGLVIELGLNNRTENLLDREADIAIRMVRPVQDALVAKRIGAIRLGLYACHSYLAAHGTPTSFEEVRSAGLIGFESETAGIRTLRQRGLSFGPEDFIFRTDSDLAQLAAIRAGVGIGVCHVGLGERNPELVRVLPDAFRMEFETWVVTHEDLQQVRRVRLVFDALVDGLTAYAL
ncbi:LysR family transcriptional regulator [Devosia sp. 1635]|uniref:LysR family transcriptional regulator n=1 Tax=Devosia sp. 1635 TaxID=2726066 RepID=UPI001562FB2A|nr:LysR family transcriptional regulator [Devosia sp. 1635]